MVFLFLSFYYYGAGMVDGFMNYQMYYTAGKCDNWLEYKKIANAIALPIAAPAMLIPLVGLLLIWLKESGEGNLVRRLCAVRPIKEVLHSASPCEVSGLRSSVRKA